MIDYTDCFICKKRSNPSYFFTLKDDPMNADLKDLIYKIHKEVFFKAPPDDWIHAQIYYAFERLAQCKTGEEYERAWKQIEPDVYTCDLVNWAQNGYAQKYIDAVFSLTHELKSHLSCSSFVILLMTAQLRAKQMVYEYVWKFMTEEPDEERERKEDGE